MFLPQELIRLKRDGKSLSSEAIRSFIAGIAGGMVSDAHIAAFCMAAFLNGLDQEETAVLTRAMANSGTILHWNGLDGPVIDKHSTGGVGDKTSLMLAPIAAACGFYVPMIAGRGLGHTGGTIDKLEAIPGFKTNLSLTEFQSTVKTTGCAIIGQTGELAPADKRIYAVRDVTATVENIPLITASILAKKMAAGLDGLVLNVTCGNGAFMPDMDHARALALSLTDIAQIAGLNVKTVLTDMNQVLGSSAGNGVEIREAVDYLTGVAREKRLHQVTLHLAAEMLVMGQKAASMKEAEQKVLAVLDNGKAAAVFARMIHAQGGPSDFMTRPDTYLPHAPVIMDVVADRDGILNGMDTHGIGMLLVNLRAGRARTDDVIDSRIGITDIQPLGAFCEKGKTVLARSHLVQPESKDIAAQSYLNCLTITAAPYAETPVIYE